MSSDGAFGHIYLILDYLAYMALYLLRLILAVLMVFDIIKTDILHVSGRGFIELSMGGSLYAIGLHVANPLVGTGRKSRTT